MSQSMDDSGNSDPSPPDDSQCLLYARAADEINSSLDNLEEADLQRALADQPEHASEIAELLPALQALRTLKQEYVTEAPSPAALPDTLPRVVGDYQIVREIGRGGMGVVYEARQISLNRRVALKVLPFAAMLDRRQLQRFKNEAHAAAMLHHSNIVPVHGVGCERGVHYYAMQFIDGRTLGHFVETLRVAESKSDGGETPTDDLTLPFTPGGPRPPDSAQDESVADTARLDQAGISTNHGTRCTEYYRSIVEIVIQVAEALDHAHREGVVHRDVKPSNLILDVSGKVWVTDFGLARIDSDPGLTMTGDLVGTLRYMSPEQVLAKQVIIDQRTDIYSLGVTLYELLTLQFAFSAENRQELLRRIAFEDPKPPRQISRVIPKDLETIVLKAMAKNPGDRYTSAEEMAEDLRCHLDDRPILAKRPNVGQRLAKWSRRHRSIVVSATVMLLLGVLGLAVGAALLWREQEKTKHAYFEAQFNYREAEKQRKIAIEEAEQAGHAVAESKAVLDFVVHGLLGSARPEFTQGRDVTVAQVLKNSEARMESAFPDQPLVEASVRHTLGNTYMHLGRYDSAERHLRRSRDLRTEHLGADHEVTLGAANDLGLALHSMSRFREAKKLNEETLALRRKVSGDEHISTLNAKSNLARSLLVLGKTETSREMNEEILAVRKRVLGGEHADTIESMNNLAVSLKFLGRHAECRKLYADVLAIYRRLHGDDHPRTLVAMNNLGCALRLQGHWREAADIHQDALDRQLRVLGEEHPRTLISMNNLALAKNLLGKPEEALELLQRALRSQRRLLGVEHRETLCSMGNLVSIYKKQLRLDEAQALGEQVLEVQQRLLGEEHAETLTSMNNLAIVFSRKGEYPRAKRLHEQTLDLRRRVLGDEHPETLSSMHNLASVMKQLGDLDQALELYEETLEVQRRVFGESHPTTLRTASASANILRMKGRLDEARIRYEAVLERQRERVGDDSPDTLRTQHNLALLLDQQGQSAEARARYELVLEARRGVLGDSHADTLFSLRSLAAFLHRQGLFDDAEKLLQEGLRLQRKKTTASPENLTFAVSFANAGWQLGQLLLEQKEPARAERAFDEVLSALETKPAEDRGRPAVSRVLARCYAGRALSRRQLGALETAWEDEDAWLALQTKKAAMHNFLAWRTAVKDGSDPRDLERAIRMAKVAIELEPDRAAFHNTLGVAHYRNGGWREAIASLQASVRLGGGGPYDCYFLAMAHHKSGEDDESRRWFDRGERWVKEQEGDLRPELQKVRGEATATLSIEEEVQP